MKPPSKYSRSSTPLLPSGELALIAALRARKQNSHPQLRLGIGDDCALLRPAPGEDLAVTTDFSIENVHFRRDWHPPEAIGHRCLTRGLSDLAAMGARPVAAFLSLALPPGLATSNPGQRSWTDRFLDGLLALAGRFDLPLAGGDTAQSPSLGGSSLVIADIMLVGAIKRKRALLRSGARPGDRVYVTGALGGAAAELLALERNPALFREIKTAAPGHPHLYPEPRIETGTRLARRQLANSAIDLSDGLSSDLRHLCEESGLGATLNAAAIPIHPMARLAEAAGWVPSALELALHGGEDYQLLFTAPAKKKLPATIGGVSVCPIGRMDPDHSPSPVVRLQQLDGSSAELAPGGWQHFRP